MDRKLRFCIVLVAVLCVTSVARAKDLDPNGVVEVTWSVLTWTADGYVAEVQITNKQAYRALYGWYLGFAWTEKELIWGAMGAEATMQGDCSNKTAPGGAVPHSCEANPVMEDLLPTADVSVTVANCCRAGILQSWAQNGSYPVSTFRITVGAAGNTIDTVVPPTNFTLNGDDYSCTAPEIVNASMYLADSGRRYTQAFRTYKVNCSYAQVEAEPVPGCCVSLSSFYNSSLSACPSCSCACGAFSEGDVLCDTSSTLPPYITPAASDITSATSPYARECSADGCPVSVHWHIQANYVGYFEVLLTITNRMLYQNYSHWTLTVEHPSLANITRIDGVESRSILPFGVNNTAVLYGTPSYSDFLQQAPGYLQATLLIGKGPAFTLKDGYGFPTNILFNGQTCVMPTWYPTLPSGAPRLVGPATLAVGIVSVLLSMFCISLF